MPIQTLFKVKQADRHNFCVNVIESSSPRADFYFLVILSTLIVALGLLADNLILVIWWNACYATSFSDISSISRYINK